MSTNSSYVEFDRDHDAPRPSALTALNDPIYKITSAINTLRKNGYDVPQRLLDAHSRVADAQRIPDAPVPPELSDKSFDKRFAEYVTAFARWESERSARETARAEFTKELKRIATDCANEVLDSMRAGFAADAETFTDAHWKLRGVDTIGDAANADLTGETVAAWHRRGEAAKRLNVAVDVVKSLLAHMNPNQWRTEDILLMVAEIPGDTVMFVRNVVRDSHLPSDVRRADAIVSSGYSLELIPSVQAYADRLAALR